MIGSEGNEKSKLSLVTLLVLGLSLVFLIIAVFGRGWSYSIPLHLSSGEYKPDSNKDDYRQYFGLFRADKDTCKDGKNSYGDKGDCDKTKSFHSLIKDIMDDSKDTFADKKDRSKYLDQYSSFQGSTTAVIVLSCFIFIIVAAASIPLAIYGLGKGMPFGLSDRQGMAITTVFCGFCWVMYLIAMISYRINLPSGKFTLVLKSDPDYELKINMHGAFELGWAFALFVVSFVGVTSSIVALGWVWKVERIGQKSYSSV
eukprot:TRINITY_DN82273_c0_g1_i1.p1 TRINITY_DN82273_c0_g1~~TRINITY_DN82273_c0_g1_i1.p1  ORF type:complete len:257 (-),score=49.53 TRINITY_DN82273_c0_g1_i1:155-925(-)